MTALGIIFAFFAVLLLTAFVATLLDRPQRGVLILAAVVPFNGLLLLVPHPGIVDGWKEVLVGFTFVAAVMSPHAVPWSQVRLPSWAAPVGGLILLSLISSVFVPNLQAVQALKIGYFYVLVAISLLRSPFTARDRDRLVTILMVTGEITAFYGILQQVLGQGRLAALGYEYNESIRTAGGFLRSFSSFNQPFGFGLFIMLVLLVAGSVALSDPKRWRNAIFLALSPMLLVGMSLSIVRGAYLGLAVGAALLAAVRYRALLLGIPLAIAVLLNLPASVLGTVFSSSSLGERGSGWSDFMGEILRSPFGIGVGSTGSVAEKVAALTGSRTTTYQPDSQFVKVLLELGILGLWLFLLLMGFALAAALITADRSVDPDSALALGIAAGILAAIGASTVSTYFEIFPIDVFFWMFLGVLACIPISGSTRSHFAPEEVAYRPTSASSSPP